MSEMNGVNERININKQFIASSNQAINRETNRDSKIRQSENSPETALNVGASASLAEWNDNAFDSFLSLSSIKYSNQSVNP